MQVYLCIEGSGSERAELIRRFYEIGIQGENTKFTYPDIKPEVMASMNELLDTSFRVEDIVIRSTIAPTVIRHSHPSVCHT